MDNYKTIEERVSSCSSFNGNSLRGFWDGDTYKVYSYNTLIATNGESKWINPEKYSQTTTRQQNLIRRAWGLV